jgi:hypothetical protein
MNEQKQVAKLISVIAENIPEMTGPQRQRWITDPKALQRILSSLNESRWTVRDGILYLSVMSDGVSGKEWIKRFEKKDLLLCSSFKETLLSMKATKGVQSEVAIIKGEMFGGLQRQTSNFLLEAKSRKFKALNLELACLIFNEFDLSEMFLAGVSILVAQLVIASGSAVAIMRKEDFSIVLQDELTNCSWSESAGFIYQK